MKYGVVYQPTIWVSNKQTGSRFRCISEGACCLTHERASELLHELLDSDWWVHDFGENPRLDGKSDVHYTVFEHRLEYL